MSILKQLQANHSKPGTWMHPGVDLGLVVPCGCKAECHLVAWGRLQANRYGCNKWLFQDEKGTYRYVVVQNEQVFPLAILRQFTFAEPCASVRVPALDKKSALKVAQEIASFHTDRVIKQFGGQFYRVAPCSRCGKQAKEVYTGKQRPTDKAYYLYLNELIPVMDLFHLAGEGCVCPKK